MKRKILILMATLCSLLIFSQPALASSTKKTTTTIPSTWIKTVSKNSYVVLKKNTYFLTSKNKKTKTLAKKGKGYRIYYLRYGKKIYYATKNKQWLPISAVYGTVWYKAVGGSMMVLTTKKTKSTVTYTTYDPVATTSLVLKRNSYVYNSRGYLNKGTVKVLKKGTRLKGYSIQKVNGTSFYVTNKCWIKAKNVSKTKKV